MSTQVSTCNMMFVLTKNQRYQQSREIQMKREIIKRKTLQKMIKAEYKKYPEHKKIKLGRIFRLNKPDVDGCNWSISINRGADWELAADYIRPFIISLRSEFMLADETHPEQK